MRPYFYNSSLCGKSHKVCTEDINEGTCIALLSLMLDAVTKNRTAGAQQAARYDGGVWVHRHEVEEAQEPGLVFITGSFP